MDMGVQTKIIINVLIQKSKKAYFLEYIIYQDQVTYNLSATIEILKWSSCKLDIHNKSKCTRNQLVEGYRIVSFVDKYRSAIRTIQVPILLTEDFFHALTQELRQCSVYSKPSVTSQWNSSLAGAEQFVVLVSVNSSFYDFQHPFFAEFLHISLRIIFLSNSVELLIFTELNLNASREYSYRRNVCMAYLLGTESDIHNF